MFAPYLQGCEQLVSTVDFKVTSATSATVTTRVVLCKLKRL